jgi:hypothetical protein
MTTQSTTHTHSRPMAGFMPKVGAGVIGGLIGGVVFGMMMQLMDMMGLVAMLVGSESPVVGWLVHLVISAFIGATFAVLLGRGATRPATSALVGAGYGIVWWIIGALLLMPAKLGMNDMIFHVGTTQWQSLMGHVIYGLLTGLTVALLAPRLYRRGR